MVAVKCGDSSEAGAERAPWGADQEERGCSLAQSDGYPSGLIRKLSVFDRLLPNCCSQLSYSQLSWISDAWATRRGTEKPSSRTREERGSRNFILLMR